MGVREAVASGAGSDRASAHAGPIHYATGTVILPQHDLDLPGPPALELRRVHRSGHRDGRWFGPAWTSTFDQRAEVHADGVHVFAADGAASVFPHPGDGSVAACPPPGERAGRVRLRSIRYGYAVTDPGTGLTAHYTGAGDRLPLTSVDGPGGGRIELRHGPDGAPAEVVNAVGRALDVETASGRVVAIRRRNDLLAAYTYDRAGNLVEAACQGRVRRFAYDRAGRVTEWDDGDRHAYAYDALGRCVHASGPRELTLEYESRGTSVRDADGNHTVYLYDGLSQLVECIDYALDPRAS
ncbi:RHS repeat domain-containing protein [Nonomuraea endophytica]|uniref:YD repeat-containing protein n=1 Tax=Nonomuraea endophytica TaxID=714136 RepID=A0A7W8A7U4_9ACTN|nr:RHS repeat domain-containing protein [Nonomuraea endophytica]MBB5080659.1 YD repeat-containing protein [Nonomuraea endophytica]